MDGEQAIHRLSDESFKPDLVIIDLNVPKVSGFAFLERCPPDIQVVIFSSSSNPQDRQRAFELGARDFAQKPTDLDEFARQVSESFVLGEDVSHRWRELRRRRSTLSLPFLNSENNSRTFIFVAASADRPSPLRGRPCGVIFHRVAPLPLPGNTAVNDLRLQVRPHLIGTIRNSEADWRCWDRWERASKIEGC